VGVDEVEDECARVMAAAEPTEESEWKIHDH
jgi:hypothetical protein